MIATRLYFFDFKYESDKRNADKTIVSYRAAVRIPQDDNLFHALKHSVSLRETLCFTPRNESFQALKQSVSNKVCTVLDLVDNFACYT